MLVGYVSLPRLSRYSYLSSCSSCCRHTYTVIAYSTLVRSACEPLTISKATPDLTTTVKDGSGTTVDDANPAALGTKVHDTAAHSRRIDTCSYDDTEAVTYTY